MSVTADRHATYEALLKLPENVVGEIVNGELFASPRPAPRHANAYSGILSELRGPYQSGRGGPGGWWILGEPELHFAENVLVPDVGGWRRERLPRLPETTWFDVAPDWICEVLSPSTARLDRAKKLPVYATEGVAFAWLVDPIEETVEVLKLQGGLWALLHVYTGEDQMAAPPFEETTIDLRTLWTPRG